ncbi:MAG TPA: hypothetical protein VF507_04680 [Pyrinomonadaceae bacterium]|jgi:hypothetical protein
MPETASGLLKDKFIILLLLVLLLAVLVIFRLSNSATANAGIGFVENAVLMVLASFLTLLRNQPQQENRVSIDTANVNPPKV